MSHSTVLVVGEGVGAQLAPFEEGSTLFEAESGNRAKWDWYVVGGRWRGYFKLLPGRTGQLGDTGAFDNKARFDADQAKKGDIDWEGMYVLRQEQAKKLWQEAQAKSDTDRYWSYGVEPDDTEESYVRRQSSSATFALLKDGQWYERGEMGWFGSVGNEKDEETWNREWWTLVNSLPPDTLLTVVDVHI